MISDASAQQYGIGNLDLDEIKEIEGSIQDDWFVERINEAGVTEVWLRVHVTGHYPRRVGPFSSKYDAVVVLSCFLCRIEDELPAVIEGDDYVRLVLEDELASTYTQKGGGVMPGHISPMTEQFGKRFWRTALENDRIRQERIESQWELIRSMILDASNQFDTKHPRVNPWPINGELEGFVRTALEYYTRHADRFGVDKHGLPKTTCAARKGR